MTRRALTRGVRSIPAAVLAAGALCGQAHAQTFSDAYPTPQAVAAHAEFLTQAPAPAEGAASVCVIDTGVTALPDLGDRVLSREAVDGGDGDDIRHTPANPFSGHGSFVAGTIASQVDGQGSAGIWPRAGIRSVRVFGPGGATSAGYRVAIFACRAYPDVKVISLSLSGITATPDELARLEDRIGEVRTLNRIDVVASTGNDGAASINYPARFPAVFAVSATDPAGAFCLFANRGEGTDLAALGCDTTATAFDGRLGLFAGTSFATPVVSGVLAALRSHKPELGPEQAEQLLRSTARQTAAGPVLDAASAFRAAGLGALVDAYRAPAAAPTPAIAPTVRTVIEAPSIAPSVDPAPVPTPLLRSVSYRKRTLTIRLKRPAPKGADVIVTVDGRTYTRHGTRLVVKRLRGWKRVTVCFEDMWGDRSALTVRRRTR